MKIPKGIPIYGDLSHRDSNCRVESTEQKEFWGWLKEFRPQYHRIAIHPKNEGSRSHSQAQADKDQGCLNKGASDIIIPAILPFVCEMKRADHTESTISKEQIAYLNDAIGVGAFGCLALGSKGAILAFLEWEIKLSKILLQINLQVTCR